MGALLWGSCIQGPWGGMACESQMSSLSMASIYCPQCKWPSWMSSPEEPSNDCNPSWHRLATTWQTPSKPFPSSWLKFPFDIPMVLINYCLMPISFGIVLLDSLIMATISSGLDTPSLSPSILLFVHPIAPPSQHFKRSDSPWNWGLPDSSVPVHGLSKCPWEGGNQHE